MEQQMYIAPSTNHAMEPGPFSEVNRTGTWRDYVTVTKLGITMGNMIAVVGGFWLGWRAFLHANPDETFQVLKMVMTLIGTALVIMAGTSLNNYIDRDLDQQMERTRQRPTATGILTPKKVLVFGFFLAIIGTAILVAFANVLSALLGLIGLFVYVVVYTMWLKRTSSLSTVIGGISGAIPPLMGYAAASNGLDATAWVIFFFMFLWQPPHFLALAIRRVEDYRAGGIPLLPVLYGFEVTKRHSLRYVAAMVPVSLLLYGLGAVGLSYLIVAMILGVGYLFISVQGFFAKDDIKWARQSFVYSLIYLTTLFVMMIVSAN
ncbi:heme o synthase [Effusibacillus dendaii]|uniref:Protoheme IX farnesyltransferase n=1 Tax=Effusibacillus dendaii TaxID=2743772 RepID=A0A7I8DEA7_9BACL|nr:heme o synthase [Effusibacillus dendaii]BCJ86870.1 protoheme IX farnesyltransferase 2 [Effusibacillus dendaii]